MVNANVMSFDSPTAATSRGTKFPEWSLQSAAALALRPTLSRGLPFSEASTTHTDALNIQSVKSLIYKKE